MIVENEEEHKPDNFQVDHGFFSQVPINANIDLPTEKGKTDCQDNNISNIFKFIVSHFIWYVA